MLKGVKSKLRKGASKDKEADDAADISHSGRSAKSTKSNKSGALDQSNNSQAPGSTRTPRDLDDYDDTTGETPKPTDPDEELEPYFDEVESSGTVVVDPQAYKLHLTCKVNIFIAILNVILGVVYIVWRVLRSMVKDRSWTHWRPPGSEFVPEDDEKVWTFNMEMEANWFKWLFLLAEILLMLGIWHSHASRFWPLKRTKCTMNDLVEADYELSRRTQICIVLPVRGKPLALLREVIFAIMSLHLWPGKLDVRRNLRLIVSDDDRRPEVVTLVSLCYKFATLFTNNRKLRAQLKREARSDISVAQFFEYYLQCTAGFGRTHDDAYDEAFTVADLIFQLCRENCIPADWDDVELPQGQRVEASVNTDLAVMPRLREDYDEIRNLLSIVYYSRSDPGTPTSCPAAGELNTLLFPDDPADYEILGGAKFLVVNDPCHAFKSEYLQRTIPYFFKIHKEKKEEKGTSEIRYVIREDLAFVTIPSRFPATRDRDPLGYCDHIRYDIEAVGRDGMGGVVASDHGTIYRVDVLKDGKDTSGKQVVPVEKSRENIGKGLGFSEKTIKEHLTTSIDLFCRGYKSIFVNEAHENLTICLDSATELDDKIQAMYDRYRASLEILAQDPWGLAKAKTANIWQRLFFMEDLVTEFIRGFAVVLLIVCICLYCFLWRPPFNIHGVEFLFYFLPYYVSAALPTAVAMNWKLIQPDPTFRSIQVASALAYVAVWAGMSAIFMEFSRVFCSRSGKRRSMGGSCPTWPLYMTNVALVSAMTLSTVHWITQHYSHPGMWMTQVVCVLVMLVVMWPITRRGSRMKGFSSFFIRYCVLGIMLIIVGLWSGAAQDAIRKPKVVVAAPPKST